MLPAESGRVFAACATSVGKSKVMSTPAFGFPNSAPLTWLSSGNASLAPSKAWPSSSGLTATGEKADEGLAWKKPKPLARSEEHTSQLHAPKDTVCRLLLEQTNARHALS